MKPVKSTPTPSPGPRRRARTPSGGDPIDKPKKVEIPKLSLEQQLEIIEKLQNNDYDQSAGIEQWFPTSHPTIKPLQHTNLMKSHGLFGSVPMNLGQRNICQTPKQTFTREQILSVPELNAALDKNPFTRKRFGKFDLGHNSDESTGSVFSTGSPSRTDSSFDDETQEGVKNNLVKAFHAFTAAVDHRQDAIRRLMEERRKNEGIPLAIDLDEFDELVRKIQGINSSFEKLKMNDRLGSIDINKLHPNVENVTGFLPCPVGDQRDVINGIYSTSDFFQTLSNWEKKMLDFSDISTKEKLSDLEKTVNDLQGLLSIEEKETKSVKNELDLKTKVLSVDQDEPNECSFDTGGLFSSPSTYDYNKSY